MLVGAPEGPNTPTNPPDPLFSGLEDEDADSFLEQQIEELHLWERHVTTYPRRPQTADIQDIMQPDPEYAPIDPCGKTLKNPVPVSSSMLTLS